VMGDAGYNVSKKRRARGVIGNKHRVTREESMKWFQQKVGAADVTDDLPANDNYACFL